MLALLFQRVISNKQSQRKNSTQHVSYSLRHDDAILGKQPDADHKHNDEYDALPAD